MLRIWILPLLLASTVATAGAVYKWTDKNGRVHYTDKPVLTGEKVQPKPGTQATEPSPDEVAKAERDAECINHKGQLAVYQSAARLLETDSLGREKEFSPEERQKLIEITEQKVKAACGARPLPAPAAAAAPPPASPSPPPLAPAPSY